MSVRERGNSWQVDIHLTHERHFATLSKNEYSYEQALEFEKELRRQLGKPTKGKVNINSVIHDYLAWVKNQQSPATLKFKKYVLFKHILPYFGYMTPERITEGVITAYKNKRKQEVVSAVSKGNSRMINLELLTLRHLCKKMFKERIEAELLPDKRKLPTVLTQDEVKRFLDALEPKYKLFFQLMYETGSRLNEVLSLKYSDIDGNIVTIRGKGGRWRTVPISSALSKELALPRDTVSNVDTSIFPFVNIYKAVSRAKKKAGIDKRIYPHLLRHSLGTHVIEHGGDIRTLQEILGHKELTTTQIYTHISNVQKRKVLSMVTNMVTNGDKRDNG
jgi:integrase/recombinase XerD